MMTYDIVALKEEMLTPVDRAGGAYIFFARSVF
jgi:hypothetical protein